ncbi:hypothetical protein A1E03_09025 [Campylobacter jejuni]|nr:hypothetical protein [Campylobacter jejuni]
MLPQPIFLNKLIEFLSDENLDIVNMKKGVDKIFCRRKNKMSQKKNKMSYFCDKLSFFQP